MSSGRYEKELVFETRTKNKLEHLPSVMTEYYYHLVGSGSSFITVDNYINYISMFLKFTFNNNTPEDFYLKVKAFHVNKYISSLRTKVVGGQVKRTSDSLRAIHWSALNSFFQFLVPNYIKENPVAETKRPKMKDNPNVTYLTQEEMGKILTNINKTANDKMRNRDLCIVKLGLSTGLRISAIVQIDLDDVDWVNGQIRITEKGDVDHYVMIGDNVKKQIKLWIDDRDKYFPNNTGALFISQHKKRISPDAVRKLLTKYTEGITDKHITPHVMRHSCATNLYEKTGDIYLCARQLNHKNVSTTQRYAEISKAKQKEAANILDDMI
jgi:integrase/recombinase XerC